MRTRSWTSLIALLAATGTAHAQPRPAAAAPAPTAVPGAPRITTWQLANGLQVAHVETHRAPVVAVELWYRAGSVDEPAGKHGVAKLLEMLMFQGSTHVRPRDHAGYVEAVGGVARADTLEDAAGYHDLVPSAYFELAVRLEADRMRGLVWRQREVDGVRGRLAANLPQVTADPSKQAVWRLHELLYGGHGYAREAIDDRLDLDAITLADVKKFYDTYYVPNNALLVVAGDVTEAQVRAAADKWLAPLARAADPPRAAPPKPVGTAQRRELPASQIGLVFHGWRIPEATQADVDALQMASLVLGFGRSARIPAKLIQERRMAADAGAAAVLRAQPGVFLAFASFQEPALTRAVENALAGEVAALAKTPPSQAEMERARNQLMAEFLPRLETVTGLANQTGMSWVLTGDAGRYLHDLDAMLAVSAADVQKAVATYLTSDTRMTVVVPPEAP